MVRFGKVGSLETGILERKDDNAMTKLDEYLRITEAAEYVGVAPNTLRNWGRSGKLTERRHPVNGYRLYAREELEALLKKADKTGAKPKYKRKPR